uniref:PCI domain-containing protein n=1 Tax=Alexandrium monilatum TaxID=311494 RepID=A0A7S4SB44_9DINO
MVRSRSPARGFQARFARLVEERDGRGLHALLWESEREPISAGLAPSPPDDVASEIVSAGRAGKSEEAFEALCRALKLWIARYLGLRRGVDGSWMLLPLLWLAAQPRRLAAELDAKGQSKKNQTKLVEAMRDHFQKLHRDERRREGALVACCELLRLYFRMGQASQCSPILKKVSQGQGGEQLDLEALPKALAVTLCFLWGKHSVMEGNVVEAEERLSWALSRCPPGAESNRRQILAYLVPCRLRTGRFPSMDLLTRNGLGWMQGLIKSVADGDVRRFDEEFDLCEDRLVRDGSYLVVEKLKLLAYRNLARKVHMDAGRRLEAAGKAEHRHKQDLAMYERAFKWQDSCDADETLCLLAHLIHLGAVRGFISDEFRKIVFSKENPFPDPSKWCPGA